MKIEPYGEWYRGDVFEFEQTRWARLNERSWSKAPMEEDFVVWNWLCWFRSDSPDGFSTLIMDINDVERLK